MNNQEEWIKTDTELYYMTDDLELRNLIKQEEACSHCLIRFCDGNTS